jgi:hypothetical protein
VTWWREGRLIDSSWDLTFTGDVQNSLEIGPLTRSVATDRVTYQGRSSSYTVRVTYQGRSRR